MEPITGHQESTQLHDRRRYLQSCYRSVSQALTADRRSRRWSMSTSLRCLYQASWSHSPCLRSSSGGGASRAQSFHGPSSQDSPDVLNSLRNRLSDDHSFTLFGEGSRWSFPASITPSRAATACEQSSSRLWL